MQAKEYLRQLGWLRRKVDNAEHQLEEMRKDRSYVKAAGGGEVKVQTSSSGTSAALTETERIVDMEAKLAVDIERYHSLKRKIVSQIDQLLDDRYREILLLRYVEGMSLNEVAEEMRYSYDYVQHMHGFALLEFQKTHKSFLQKI